MSDHVNIFEKEAMGAEIKEKLISLAKPILATAIQYKLAGVSIPIDENVDFSLEVFPLPRLIQCVLREYGSIYVDETTSDELVALRTQLAAAEAAKEKAEGALDEIGKASSELVELLREHWKYPDQGGMTLLLRAIVSSIADKQAERAGLRAYAEVAKEVKKS